MELFSVVRECFERECFGSGRVCCVRSEGECVCVREWEGVRKVRKGVLVERVCLRK